MPFALRFSSINRSPARADSPECFRWLDVRRLLHLRGSGDRPDRHLVFRFNDSTVQRFNLNRPVVMLSALTSQLLAPSCALPCLRNNPKPGETRFRGMLLVIAILLLLFWFGGLAFHVAGGLIHILIVIAVIMFILHFVRGRRV